MEKIRQCKTKQPKLEPPAKAPETISNRIEWPKTESSTQIFKINFKNEIWKLKEKYNEKQKLLNGF